MYIKMSTKLRGSVDPFKERWRAGSRKGLSDISHRYGSDPVAGAPRQSPPPVKDGCRWVWTHSAAVFELLCRFLGGLSTVCKYKRVCVCVREVAGERFGVDFAEAASYRMLTSLRCSHHREHENPQDSINSVSDRPPLRTNVHLLHKSTKPFLHFSIILQLLVDRWWGASPSQRAIKMSQAGFFCLCVCAAFAMATMFLKHYIIVEMLRMLC